MTVPIGKISQNSAQPQDGSAELNPVRQNEKIPFPVDQPWSEMKNIPRTIQEPEHGCPVRESGK